jgi:hypothetical protein
MAKNAKGPERGWFEDYTCGCVSDIVRFKKDLLGYCGQHGTDRRQIRHVNHPAMKSAARREGRGGVGWRR